MTLARQPTTVKPLGGKGTGQAGCIAAPQALTNAILVEYKQAIQTARQQGAKSFELRAALRLARLLIGRGRSAEAGGLFAPVYAWFTEGFNMADLQEARELLATLGA